MGPTGRRRRIKSFAAAARLRANFGPKETFVPRCVLIADDNESVRQVLVDYVITTESEVLEASNGLEALWIVKHQRPDLVLLDLSMPRLGGLETIRHIRKFDPA